MHTRINRSVEYWLILCIDVYLSSTFWSISRLLHDNSHFFFVFTFFCSIYPDASRGITYYMYEWLIPSLVIRWWWKVLSTNKMVLPKAISLVEICMNKWTPWNWHEWIFLNPALPQELYSFNTSGLRQLIANAWIEDLVIKSLRFSFLFLVISLPVNNPVSRCFTKQWTQTLTQTVCSYASIEKFLNMQHCISCDWWL